MGWCWLGVLLPSAQDLHVALEEQSAFPTHLCSACSLALRGELQFGSSGLEPAGCIRHTCLAAAVVHLDER